MSLFSLKTYTKKNRPAGTMLGHGIFSGVLISLIISLALQLIPLVSSAADANAPFAVKDLEKIQLQLGKTEDSMESLSSLYHQTVNNLVNVYMDAFTQNNSDNKALTAPPKNVTDCETVGAKMNLSTYCLFLRIDSLYSAYSRTLNIKQNTILQDINAIQHGGEYQDATASAYVVRQQWITKELTASRSALDSVLRSYSELLIQYPMHLEYQKTLKLLIKYYDHLVDVRKKVDTYPARFQDVTTANCT